MAITKRPTKKAIKAVKKKAAPKRKIVVRVKARKAAEAPEAPKEATTSVVREVFSTTQPEVPSIRTVPSDTVLLFVNGRSKGTVAHVGKTLLEFATAQASSAGIRTFSLYVDDVKADSGITSRPASSFAKIEIIAKDARGNGRN